MTLRSAFFFPLLTSSSSSRLKIPPARWLNLPEAYNPVFSQFSFMAGPHGCIGKTMAISEMKAVLVCVSIILWSLRVAD
jgi:hypothetical protein